MSNLLAKYQFIAFLEITCHGIILSPAEKLIDNLLRKIYFILTYFDQLVRSLSLMVKSLITKRWGPLTLPWVVPLFTECHVQVTPLNISLCFLSINQKAYIRVQIRILNTNIVYLLKGVDVSFFPSFTAMCKRTETCSPERSPRELGLCNCPSKPKTATHQGQQRFFKLG